MSGDMNANGIVREQGISYAVSSFITWIGNGGSHRVFWPGSPGCRDRAGHGGRDVSLASYYPLQALQEVGAPECEQAEVRQRDCERDTAGAVDRPPRPRRPRMPGPWEPLDWGRWKFRRRAGLARWSLPLYEAEPRGFRFLLVVWSSQILWYLGGII